MDLELQKSKSGLSTANKLRINLFNRGQLRACTREHLEPYIQVHQHRSTSSHRYERSQRHLSKICTLPELHFDGAANLNSVDRVRPGPARKIRKSGRRREHRRVVQVVAHQQVGRAGEKLCEKSTLFPRTSGTHRTLTIAMKTTTII
ncbi:uncharacterized protein LOC143915825 [Arctopsyche grandis]|uniref:uncharacterized protein LOC143915825 n=1 Tax=Arctopsyche grandis TaxID=121162 RepID=UPI00406DA196